MYNKMHIENLLSESIKVTPLSFVSGILIFQYSITTRLPEHRQYIADQYNRIFDLHLTIDNIITIGSQQALDLIGKVLLNKRDGIIVEKPTHLAAIQAFSMHRPVFYPIDLTKEGMNPEQLVEALRNPVKLIYAIPDFQNPTGLTYSAKNRKCIYEILKDYDSQTAFCLERFQKRLRRVCAQVLSFPKIRIC